DEHGAELRAAGDTRATIRAGSEGPTGRLPLEGVTVLEMAFFFAAPYGATLLTDLGARVIKIEPLEGDPIRNMLGFPEASGMHVFQGKESLAIDIKAPEAQEVVRQLAARADILLTSFRPGTMDRMGVGPTALRAVNPDLVVMNAMGYGIDGPYADKPAFAPSISSGSGMSMRNVGPRVRGAADASLPAEMAESTRLASAAPGLANPDGLSATAVASGILLGLLARARTGTPPRMLTSMMGTSAHVLVDQMLGHRSMAALPAPDEELYGLSARYRLYETAEGWVFLAAPDERGWPVLAEAFGLGSDPRFADAGARLAHEADLADEIGKAFRGASAAEWEQRLLAVGAGCVALPGEASEYVFQSDFGRDSGYLAPAEHPMVGDYERSAPSMSFSRSATQALGGCLTGQHTREVLRELGYEDAPSPIWPPAASSASERRGPASPPSCWISRRRTRPAARHRRARRRRR
ncbi:MAG: Crotonobetainyl-CoA:carnitine CoA-transferase CaiB, partial [Ilumatobacteraceae bacterium]|nr:Crotonobetainyl-CoA:carnitine CoA-transferase CaiB [Ilumatobacteraceae bacterium]